MRAERVAMSVLIKRQKTCVKSCRLADPGASAVIEALADTVRQLEPEARERLSNALQGITGANVLVENTNGARNAVAALKQEFERDWFNALQRFDREQAKVAASRASKAVKARRLNAARARLENDWTSIIRRNYEKSFRLGHAARGGTGSAGLTTMQIQQIAPELEATVLRQANYAGQFARQYASGALNAKRRMGVGPRSELYSKSLFSGYNIGAVSVGKPGEKIYWNLGACFHCPDCPAIANSGPYTRDTLPCYPGDGCTVCGSNCCCHLTFKPGPEPETPPAQDGDAERLRNPRRTAPPGFTPPTDSQLTHLNDLEARRNYARRKVAELPDGKERKKWIRIRSDLQGQINTFKADNNLHKPPTFSVGATLSRADLTTKDVNGIFARGLDGTTIRAGDLAKTRRMVAKADADLTAAFAEIGVPPPNVSAGSGMSLEIRTTPAGGMDVLADIGEGRNAKETKPKLMEASVGNAIPTVEPQWTVNIIGNGSIANIKILLGLVDVLAGELAFVQVGPLDETWPRFVSAAGAWLRGNGDDVKAVLDRLKKSKGVPPFLVAPYVSQ